MKSVSIYALLTLVASSCHALSAVSANPAIKVAAQAMTFLKPVFAAEAKLQASLLGGNTDSAALAKEIQTNKKNNKVLIYTYGLSPFSSEALSILEGTGYDYTTIELGAEWFLLGGEESKTRVLLSEEVESGATSLPKVFIGGSCVGGCAELSTLAETGVLEGLLKKSGASKKGEPKKAFTFFK